MAVTRNRSTPSAKSSSTRRSEGKPSNTAPNQGAGQPQQPSLAARADAIRKIQWELNIRALSSQTERLEGDLKLLIRSTDSDRAFRNQHEERLKELWKEMLSVRSHVAKQDERQDGLKADFAELRSETLQTMQQAKHDLDDLKDTVTAVHLLLDQLPSQDEIDEELAKQARDTQDSGFGTEAGDSQRTQRRGSDVSKKPKRPDPHDNDVPTRIQQAIGSTRRWNRDFKKTDMEESHFVARYFRQQSKRDPRMAVLIQKNVMKQVKPRLPAGDSRPSSIEEFSRHVKWHDILQTVDKVLGRETGVVWEALSQ